MLTATVKTFYIIIKKKSICITPNKSWRWKMLEKVNLYLNKKFKYGTIKTIMTKNRKLNKILQKKLIGVVLVAFSPLKHVKIIVSSQFFTDKHYKNIFLFLKVIQNHFKAQVKQTQTHKNQTKLKS